MGSYIVSLPSKRFNIIPKTLNQFRYELITFDLKKLTPELKLSFSNS